MTCDPVGAREIAARLGVSHSTVRAWRARHADFPTPLYTVNGAPAYSWDDVATWATKARPRGRPKGWRKHPPTDESEAPA